MADELRFQLLKNIFNFHSSMVKRIPSWVSASFSPVHCSVSSSWSPAMVPLLVGRQEDLPHRKEARGKRTSLADKRQGDLPRNPNLCALSPSSSYLPLTALSEAVSSSPPPNFTCFPPLAARPSHT